MPNLSRQPQRIAEEQYQSLSKSHIFAQYMLQDQTRDQVFVASLTTFKTELNRIRKVAKLRRASLDWYLSELRELRQQFDAYISTLRRQGLFQFTFPMELALFAIRTQWFMRFQGPQIRRGWQQAGQGLQHTYDDESSTD